MGQPWGDPGTVCNEKRVGALPTIMKTYQTTMLTITINMQQPTTMKIEDQRKENPNNDDNTDDLAVSCCHFHFLCDFTIAESTSTHYTYEYL